MISTRQEAALEWLCRLEELALQNNLKMRLLDAIRDCRKELEQELTETEWRQKCIEIEELLEQIKKQILPGRELQELETGVEERASEILLRCRRSNELLQSEYCNAAVSYIQETEVSMQEFSNVRANYKEVADPDRFLKAFRDIGQKHKLRIDDQQEQYVKTADQNYMNAFDRLKGLVAGTGMDETAKRKFYHGYYENMDTLAANAREYARGNEKGESCIVKFAESMLKPLKKIFSGAKIRARLVKLLPIIALVIYWVINKLPGYLETLRGVEQSQEVGIKTQMYKMLLDASSFMMVKLPLILLAILVYVLWCEGISLSYRAYASGRAGRLLGTSLEQFKQGGTLQNAVKESYERIGSYMQRQYEGLLPDLLPDKLQEEQEDSSESTLMMLLAKWEDIKRKEADN